MKMTFRIFIFFVLVVFGANNFVFAAENIDWSHAKRINSREELASYIRDCEKNLITDIRVIIPKSLKVGDLEPIKDMILIPEMITTRYSVKNDPDFYYVRYVIKCYPGSKVVYAYKTGKTSILNAEERQLYNEGLKLLREINSLQNETAKAYWINFYLSNKVEYFHDPASIKVGNMPHFTTAYGALIEGKANCQGFTDAFYMLGSMSGLNVDRVLGLMGKDSHAWNMIQYKDGKSYFIDATSSAGYNQPQSGGFTNLMYLNIPLEIAQADHSWKTEYLPMNNFQQVADWRYPFYSENVNQVKETVVKNFGGIIRCADAGSALDKAARGIAVKKYSTCWLMINYNSDYSTSEQLAAYLVKKIESYTARKITCTLWSFVRGKYIFCVVKSSE